MRWLKQRNWKPLAFYGLMGLSALSLLAPAGWSDGLKHFTQLLAPFQSLVYAACQRTVRDMRQSVGERQDAPGQSDDRRVDAMVNSVVALNQMLEAARLENGRLKGLRDRYVPPGVRLVTARVATRDISAARDTLLLSRGAGLDADKKVRKHDAVTSRLFVSAGNNERVNVGHLVLAREFFLGEVDYVSPLASRVRLCSDLGARTEVRIGRVVGSSFHIVPYPCVLVGEGRGEMIIVDVPRRHTANESSPGDADVMRIGDLVMSLPRPPAMPSGMAIGYIEAFEPDLRKPLVTNVRVRPALPMEEIEDVFIVSRGAED